MGLSVGVGLGRGKPCRLNALPAPGSSHTASYLLFQCAIDLHRFTKNGRRNATGTQVANAHFPAWGAMA